MPDPSRPIESLGRHELIAEITRLRGIETLLAQTQAKLEEQTRERHRLEQEGIARARELATERAKWKTSDAVVAVEKSREAMARGDIRESSRLQVEAANLFGEAVSDNSLDARTEIPANVTRFARYLFEDNQHRGSLVEQHDIIRRMVVDYTHDLWDPLMVLNDTGDLVGVKDIGVEMLPQLERFLQGVLVSRWYRSRATWEPPVATSGEGDT